MLSRPDPNFGIKNPKREAGSLPTPRAGLRRLFPAVDHVTAQNELRGCIIRTRPGGRGRVRTGSQAIRTDKPNRFAHIVLTSLILLFALLTTPALANPIDAKALERFVIQDCGSCHGLTLKGGLGPDIRPQSIEHYDPEILQSVILDGVSGTPMPPWRPLLSEAEAAWIADYLLKGEAP
ncbi:cytochrome c [Tropicibacter sp. R15_0]|nr:cytochrome c [Tropicibacter sp. R15_0]